MLRDQVRHWLTALIAPAPEQRQRRQVLALAFVVSALSWLFVTLSGDFVLRLSYPIEFTGVEDHVTISRMQTTDLEVEVRGRGLDLIGLLLRSRGDTLRLQYTPEYQRSGAVSVNQHAREVDSLAGSRLRVRWMKPDSIRLVVEPLEERRVPLRLAVQFRLKPGYHLEDEPRPDTDSITLIGSPAKLRQYREWATFSRTVPLSEEMSSVTLRVVDTVEGIRISPHEVEVQVSPKRYTQARIPVQLQVVHQPEQVQEVRLMPPLVEVDCLVPLEAYDRIAGPGQSYTLKIDFRELSPESPGIIPRIDTLFPQAKIIRQSPLIVSYVIVYPWR
jgi:hypothetical protein